MIATSPRTLPLSQSLTETLASPVGAGPGPAALHALRNRLHWAIVGSQGGQGASVGGTGPSLVPSSGPSSRVVDGYLLRLAGQGRMRPADDRFSWSTTTARRTLGLAAVRQCLSAGTTPTDAAIAVITGQVADARRNGARPGSLTHWLGSLGAGGRGAVIAETTGWATHLWSALDWAVVEGALTDPAAVVGQPDRWWRPPFTSTMTVALRGRADVRWSPGLGRSALLSVLPGRPGPSWRAELGLPALIDILDRPDAPPPGRVAGLWPQAGRTLVLEVDVALLEETSRWILEALRLMAPIGRPNAVVTSNDRIESTPVAAAEAATTGVAA